MISFLIRNWLINFMDLLQNLAQDYLQEYIIVSISILFTQLNQNMKKQWINSIEFGQQKCFYSFCWAGQYPKSHKNQPPHIIILSLWGSGSKIIYKPVSTKQEIFSFIYKARNQEAYPLNSVSQVNISNSTQLWIKYKQDQYRKAKIQFEKSSLAGIWKLALQKLLIAQSYHTQVKQILSVQSQKDYDDNVSYRTSKFVQNVTQQRTKQFIADESKKLGSQEQIVKVLNTVIQLRDQPYDLTAYFLGKFAGFRQHSQLQIQQEKPQTSRNGTECSISNVVKNSRNQQIERENGQLKAELQKLTAKYDKFVDQSREKQKERMKLIHNLQVENLQALSQLQRLQIQSDSLKRDLEQRLIFSAQLQSENASLKTQLGILKAQKDQMSSNIQTDKQLIQRLQNEVSEWTLKNNQLLQTTKQLQLHLQQVKTESKGYQSQIQSLNEINMKLSLQNQNLKQLAQIQNKDILSVRQEIIRLQSYIGRLQNQISEISSHKASQEKIDLLQRQYEKLLSQNQALKQSNLYHIFQGRILHNFPSEKKYLQKEIEEYTKSKIKLTRIIYANDPINPTNYHKYIDENPNFCVIVKLKNGRLIAGFSVSPVSPKTIASQGGMIYSLTQKKSFKLIEGKRSVTYDTFFLIFGNSQLRLKHGQQKFFTNFGIANSFFNSNNQKYTVLTGEGTNRQELLEDYEILQIIFE